MLRHVTLKQTALLAVAAVRLLTLDEGDQNAFGVHCVPLPSVISFLPANVKF